ncbi:hypothetical protein J7K41_02305 [Candidatus Micrarchaeota archaeon]|nr:hypothetical protein [Candidatus Micrarchaeota archaeon]
MEPIFYFFGVMKKDFLFYLVDPIVIRDDVLYDLSEPLLNNELERLGLRLDDFVSGVVKKRGIMFGIAKDGKSLSSFLELGELLSPSIAGKDICVYFLDDDRSILFKVNRRYYDLGGLKRKVWNLLRPLDLITKREFTELTKGWRERNDYYDSGFRSETSMFKLCVGRFYHSFIYLKMKKFKDYRTIKNKIYNLTRSRRRTVRVRTNIEV